MFAGNIGRVQGLETVLAAADLLRDDPEVRWVLVGDGSLHPWLGRSRGGAASGAGLPRGAPAALRHAGPLRAGGRHARDPRTRRRRLLTIPSKLQTYLAAGRPVLGSIDGEAARVIVESGAGFASPAGDAAGLAANVRRIARMPPGTAPPGRARSRPTAGFTSAGTSASPRWSGPRSRNATGRGDDDAPCARHRGNRVRGAATRPPPRRRRLDGCLLGSRPTRGASAVKSSASPSSSATSGPGRNGAPHSGRGRRVPPRRPGSPDARLRSDPVAEYRRVNTDGHRAPRASSRAGGVRRFVFVSSIKVNGEARKTPYRTRTCPPRPILTASASGRPSSRSVRVARETGLETVVLRPPLVYGPGVKANMLRLIRAVDRGLPLPFGGLTIVAAWSTWRTSPTH